VSGLRPGQVTEVPIDAVRPDPGQPRVEFLEAALNALAEDIAARGIENPIRVLETEDGYVIKHGERRWRAARMAGLETIPVLLAEDRGADDPVEHLLDQAADNHHAQPLTPLDWAAFLKKLVREHGLQVKDIPRRLEARGIRMSRSQVSNLMRLLDLPEWAKDLLREERLAPAHARAILTAAASGPVLEQLREWIYAQDAPPTVEALERHTAALFYQHHPRLSFHGEPSWNVRFDPTKACKGCTKKRQIDQQVFCLDEDCFDAKQAEAEAQAAAEAEREAAERADAAARAGEEPDAGPPEVRGEAPEQEAEGARRKRLLEDLDAWLASQIRLRLRPHARALLLWLLAGAPVGESYDCTLSGDFTFAIMDKVRPHIASIAAVATVPEDVVAQLEAEAYDCAITQLAGPAYRAELYYLAHALGFSPADYPGRDLTDEDRAFLQERFYRLAEHAAEEATEPQEDAA